MDSITLSGPVAEAVSHDPLGSDYQLELVVELTETRQTEFSGWEATFKVRSVTRRGISMDEVKAQVLAEHGLLDRVDRVLPSPG